MPDLKRRIRVLEEKLANSRKDLSDYHALVAKNLNRTNLVAGEMDSPLPAETPRDDDSHYFQSYGDNGVLCDNLLMTPS